MPTFCEVYKAEQALAKLERGEACDTAVFEPVRLWLGGDGRKSEVAVPARFYQALEMAGIVEPEAQMSATISLERICTDAGQGTRLSLENSTFARSIFIYWSGLLTDSD